jgi:hypothetical protein
LAFLGRPRLACIEPGMEYERDATGLSVLPQGWANDVNATLRNTSMNSSIPNVDIRRVQNEAPVHPVLGSGIGFPEKRRGMPHMAIYTDASRSA